MNRSKHFTKPAPERCGACKAEVLGSTHEAKIPARWKWHYDTLTKLREQLLRERAHERADCLEPLESHSMDLADSATDALDHDLTLSSISAGQDLLYEIDEALKRIRDGTYGYCQESGAAIPPKRLRAVPWTRFLAEVEARLERRGAVRARRIGELSQVRQARDIQWEEAGEESALEIASDETVQEVAIPVGERQRQTRRSG